MLLPKTRKTIKEEVLPAISSRIPSFGLRKTKNTEVAKRISDIEAVQKDILKKLEEDKQISGAFDYYHQSSPTSVSPHVLEQTYGRDLHFLRSYYQVCCPIDQLIFQKRFEQLRAVSDCVADNPKKVGWRVVHNQQDSKDFRVTKDIEQKSRWFEQLLQNQNKIRHPGGFAEILNSMAESKMLFDRIPIERMQHKDYLHDDRPLPASYLIPDSATIKPTTWVLHAMAGSSSYSGRNDVQQATQISSDSKQTASSLLTKESPIIQTAAMDIAKQLSKNSNIYGPYDEYQRLMDGVIVWVQQMQDHQIAAGYTHNNLAMFIANHSPQINTWGWSSGSAFERSFIFGELIFKMTGYNQEMFDSRMPDGVLALSNPGVDKNGKQQLKERMADEGSDRYNNLLVQFVQDPDKDVKYHKLRDKPHEMQFKEMFMLFVKLKCSAYGVDYTELNLEDGKSGGLGGTGAQEKRMDSHAATGIQSDTRYYAHVLTKAMIEPWDSNYKMEFVHDVTETEADVKLKKEKMGYTSLYETRVEDNLEDEWWKEAPKEQQEELKELGKFSYIPGTTDAGRVQLMTKQMDINMQKEMQAQEEQQEGEEGEEVPEGKEEPKEPKENEEIANLRAAIGQEEKETKELEEGMGKSLAVTVEHHYVN